MVRCDSGHIWLLLGVHLSQGVSELFMTWLFICVYFLKFVSNAVCIYIVHLIIYVTRCCLTGPLHVLPSFQRLSFFLLCFSFFECYVAVTTMRSRPILARPLQYVSIFRAFLRPTIWPVAFPPLKNWISFAEDVSLSSRLDMSFYTFPNQSYLSMPWRALTTAICIRNKS